MLDARRFGARHVRMADLGFRRRLRPCLRGGRRLFRHKRGPSARRRRFRHGSLRQRSLHCRSRGRSRLRRRAADGVLRRVFLWPPRGDRGIGVGRPCGL